MRFFLSIILSILVIAQIRAQTNYNDIRAYYLQGSQNEQDLNEGSALNQFLREDALCRPRFQNLTLQQIAQIHFANFNSINSTLRTSLNSITANWQPIGPYKRPAALSSNLEYAAGNGLFTSIRIDANDNNKIFAISALGGIWKTNDRGLNWTNLTDYVLPSTQTSDIAVDPTDPNFMYIATGDRDDYHNLVLCNGIYRSSDGGNSWVAVNTGLNSLIGFASISKILINPNNPDIIFASTSLGIFKTTNAKSLCDWTQLQDPLVNGLYFRNIFLKPDGLNTTLIASGKDIIKSTDGGITWNSLIGSGTGLDFSTLGSAVFPSRINIALTPINPNVIYASVIMKDSPTQPVWNTLRVHHLFKFDGILWQEKNAIPPNYNYQGDLTESWNAIDVSPTNENKIAIGHTSGFLSQDGGTTPLVSAYSYFGGIVHPDIHEIKFASDGNSVFFTTDGGISEYSFLTNTWSTVSDGIAANSVTRISLSQTDPDFMLMGAFHSGSSKFDPNRLPPGAPWQIISGGDGGEASINKLDPSRLYVSSQKNRISHSLNRAITTLSGIGIPPDPFCGGGIENSVDIGNFNEDPSNPDKIYIAYTDLYSYDPNSSSPMLKVTKLPLDFGISDCNDGVLTIGISEKNTKVIYFSSISTNRFFKTTSGGYDNGCVSNCWTELFPPSPQAITGIAISKDDPNKVWTSYSGYDALNKVKKFDGSTWSDYSDGLPNIPANNIVFENGSNEGLYLAMDIGIYYRNASMSQWEPFIDQLPNVLVSDIEINYKDNKIVAGTLGRGIWRSNLNCPSDFDLNVLGNDPYYEAENNLTASLSVIPNSKTNFRAGNSILLNPGFEIGVLSGQEFKAYIHACNHPGNSFRTPNFENRNIENEIDNSKENYYIIYPNPTVGVVNVSFAEDDSTNYLINIIDLSGRLIKSNMNYGESDLIIDISSLSKGIYFIEIANEDKSRHQISKIVLE